MDHHDVDLDKLGNAEANRHFWDRAVASFYEKLTTMPGVVNMYEQLTASILSSTKFDVEATVLMDFACGNGLLSARLAPYCKTVVGVDLSQGMVDAYNARMGDLDIANARALCTELKPEDPLLAGEKFDVILCVNAYKHIDDNVAITRVLKSYLKPSGVLLVIEVIQGKNAMHVVADMHSIVHGTPPSRPKNLMSHMSGYVEDDMKAIFEEAGLRDFTYKEIFEKSKDGQSFALFLAKGVCRS